MERDCMNCKHCTLRPMAYENGVTNVCDYQDRISKLSMEDLLKRIKTKKCDWMEKGKPKRSNEVVYDD